MGKDRPNPVAKINVPPMMADLSWLGWLLCPTVSLADLLNPKHPFP